MNIYDPNKAFSTSHNDPPDQSPQMHSPARQMFSRLLANVLIEQDAALRAALQDGGYALPAKTNHQLPSSNKPASTLTVGPCKRSAAGRSRASD
ncbi:hypothetical protein [Enterobacter cloacae]|jgi:hypothetical protein|uniref:hypothetical protein n=1 Tax=Enterobacter cloacae TaxID=550 RepID=UPI001BDE2CE0|nr:hypothetical protein [Enterobacter cloacae]HCR2226216.1 hypothetical protein [Enterobacter cloacae subsp. cloacae]EKT9188276.1 hypothetical protein [Enterobacter cloacae]EKU3856681.1 hypothetical protein [Enterobacter cloacae]EKX9063004.1 hypothetical protein [Enterobacter cloacae]ELR9203553.1 hypothetical protein [Enterobacter cloacae]